MVSGGHTDRWPPGFDFGCLLAALRAAGADPQPSLVLAYSTADIVALLPLTPGGPPAYLLFRLRYGRPVPGAPRRARAANRQRTAKRSDRGPPGSFGSTSIAPANVTSADVAFPLAALPGGMATMQSWIDHSGEVVWGPAPSLIGQLVEAGQPFWLDIENPTDELIDQLAVVVP